MSDNLLYQALGAAISAIAAVGGSWLKNRSSLKALDASVATSLKDAVSELKGEFKTLHSDNLVIREGLADVRERVGVREHTVFESTPPSFRSEHKTLQ